MIRKNFQIAIDGPVAAGKGTISRLVAEELDFLYVDTGAMYRSTALLALNKKIDLGDEKKIVAILKKTNIDMRNPTQEEKDGRSSTVFLDGDDVSWKIRVKKVSDASSKIAVLQKVRNELVKKQQNIAKNKNVIMEGRDITYKVLPEADLKIYLTANEIIRAKRRYLQLLTKGFSTSYDEVYQELLRRDKRDKNRLHDPLKIVENAWIIDTSDLEIEKVVKSIVNKVKAMRN